MSITGFTVSAADIIPVCSNNMRIM